MDASKHMYPVLAKIFTVNEYFAHSADINQRHFLVSRVGKSALAVRWFDGEEIDPDVALLPLASLIDIEQVFHVDVENGNARTPILAWRERICPAGYAVSLRLWTYGLII